MDERVVGSWQVREHLMHERVVGSWQVREHKISHFPSLYNQHETDIN